MINKTAPKMNIKLLMPNYCGWTSPIVKTNYLKFMSSMEFIFNFKENLHISFFGVVSIFWMFDCCLGSKSNYIPHPLESNLQVKRTKHLDGRALAENSTANIGSRIAGGRVIAKYGEIPYQVAMWNFLDSTFCGGFIADVKGVRFIITAAHCVWKGDVNATSATDPKHLSVVLADINLFVSDQRELYYQVTRVVVHEWYDPRYFLNDIALLFLKHYIYEGLAFKAIPLPEPDFAVPDYVTVAGYGLTRSFGMYDGVLRVVEVPTLDWDECKNVTTYLTNDHFCTQNPDHYGLAGFCQGDSGGAAVGYNYSQNKFYAYGIVSSYHGIYCGVDDVPNKLTRVSKYIEWIHSYALTHKLNCGTGQPILDPPSKYPNCKWPYANECHEQNCQM